MRFPQVQVGQQFTFQDKCYTKTGPLTASEEGTGSQRMIPRSAEVSLLNAVGEPVRVIKQRYTRVEMENTLAGFKANLTERLRAAAVDGSLTLEQVLALLDAAEFDD
jgi:hypothetical protein